MTIIIHYDENGKGLEQSHTFPPCAFNVELGTGADGKGIRILFHDKENGDQPADFTIPAGTQRIIVCPD